MRIVYDGLEQLAFNLEQDALQQDLDSENIMDELEEINEKRHFNLTDVQLDHFYKNFVNEDFEKSLKNMEMLLKTYQDVVFYSRRKI